MTYGGAEKVILNLIEGMLKYTTYEIDLVLLKNIGEYSKYIPKKVNIIDLDVKSEYYALFPLIKYLRHRKPQILFSNYLHISAILAVKILRGKTKNVLIFHNFIDTELTFRKKTFNIIIRRFFSKKLFYRADWSIVVVRALIKDISNYYKISKEKISVIHNPVIIDDEVSIDCNIQIMKKSRPFKILAVGRLEPEKNFILLLQAMVLLKNKLDFYVKILGDGSEKKMLSAYIEAHKLGEYVQLVGYVDNVDNYMQGSNVVVITSPKEACPNVALEALKNSRYIVSTNCIGIRDIIINEEHGIILRKNTATELSNVLYKIAQANNIDSSKIKNRAKDFLLPNIIKQYVECIERVTLINRRS
nr:glycosyltransferase [Pectinatus frisingensis]